LIKRISVKKTLSVVLQLFFIAQYLPAQIYITNTNVADVEKMQMLAQQTVVIENGKISKIVNSKKFKIPAGVKVIDGTGKYLIPGLVDAHVHFFQSGGLYTRPDVIDLRKYVPYQKENYWNHQNMEDQLRRYLGTGITTVIDVGSSINFLQQRDSFSTKSYSPTIYMTGPLLTTYEPEVYKDLNNEGPFYLMQSEEDARKYVQQQLPYKPDFIKIWYIVSHKNTEAEARKTLPLVKAVIDEAHKNKLRVAVHATERITAQLAVENGCDFLVHNVDDEIVHTDFIQLLKKNKVVLCPTMVVLFNYTTVFAQQYHFSAYDYSYSNPKTLGSLFDLKHLPDTSLVNNYKKLSNNRDSANRATDSILKINLKRMVNSGVTIATGTDAGNIGTLHATSYFDELRKMQESGMSVWQLLQSSTINGAKAVGKENEFGSIQTGKRANLLLLNANPLDNLENWKKIEIIINKGELLDPRDIIISTPETLVQQQLNGYNGHSLEAFLTPYADDIKIYNFPDSLIMHGKDDMRKQYQDIEKDASLHCEIVNRIIQGNTVIDNEHVTFAGNRSLNVTIIYHIEGNKIKTVYFL
jgi:imidazolonepropionase-like amidohydrolase